MSVVLEGFKGEQLRFEEARYFRVRKTA